MVKTKVRPKVRRGGADTGEVTPPPPYRRDWGEEPPFDRSASARLGMYIFLAALVMMFGAVAIVFLLRLPVRDAFAFILPKTAWVSTAIILFSSVPCQMMVNSARQGQHNRVLRWLALTFAFGLLFLGLQVVSGIEVARQIERTGHNVFTGLFYVFTALHGAHLFGGVAFMGGMLFSIMRRGWNPSYLLPLELGALYWHFMGGIWLMLFGVMAIR